MKKASKVNSLFYFIQDNVAQLRTDMFITHRIYLEREVFYIQLSPLLTLKSDIWDAEENHFSVEKRVLPWSDFMSPSHLTISLKQKANPAVRCRVHIYLNEMLNCQPQIHIKIFEEMPEGKRVILQESIDYLSISPEVPIVESTNLNVAMVMQILETNKRILTELMYRKLNTYSQIKIELVSLEKELNALISHVDLQLIDLKHLTRVLGVCESYLAKVLTLNRYSDSDEDKSEIFLVSLKKFLEAQIQKRESKLIKTIEAIEPAPVAVESASAEVGAAAVAHEALQLIKISPEKKIFFKASFQQLKTYAQSPQVEDIIAQAKLHRELQLELTMLSFEDLNHGERIFVNKLFNQLELLEIPIDKLYQKSVMSGDVQAIKTIEAQAILNINPLEIFSELLESIESSLTSIQVRQKLIEMSDHFYQSSDLYRAIIGYTALIKRYAFVLDDKGTLYISSLIKMYVEGNYQAFEMYVRQFGQINSTHIFYENFGLNAIQGTILLNMCKFDVRPYIHLLMKSGASIDTSGVFSDIQAYRLSVGGETQKSSQMHLSLFQKMKDAPKDIRCDRLLSSSKSQEEILSLIQQVRDCNHILKLAIKTNLLTDANMILAISQYVNIKTLLMSLVSMANRQDSLISLFPSQYAGIRFYPLSVMESFVGGILNDLSGGNCVVSNLTMSVFSFINVESAKDADSKLKNFLSAGQEMSLQLERMVQNCSAAELQILFKTLEKELISCLCKDNVMACEYFLGLLILNSYQPNKQVKDYQNILLYAHRFAVITDKIRTSKGLTPYNVVKSVSGKLSLMLSLLDSEMSQQIVAHPTLAQLKLIG